MAIGDDRTLVSEVFQRLMQILNNISSVIKDFQSKAGSFVLWASVLGKIFTFLSSWIALQLIAKDELGSAIYAFTIIAFIIPFAGMGVFQSLLQYGARLKEDSKKTQLFFYCLKYGLIASVILILILSFSNSLITSKLPSSASYFKWFTFMLISNFLFELLKVQFRIKHNNKAFAMADIAYSILLVICMFIGSYFWGAMGYTFAWIISPLVVSIVGFFYLEKPNTKYLWNNKRERLSFWSYGIFSSLGNVTTELLFAIDLILIGNLLQNEELVTAYKYTSLIPFSLLFLSHVYMSTHFVSVTSKMEDKQFMHNFIKNYLALFIIICVAVFAGSYLFGKWALAILDPSYTQYFEVFIILIIGVCGVLLLRGLFGNLISAIGKAQANFGISFLALILNGVLNYQLIPSMGIKGAAITSVCIMWFTALLSAGVFYFYYKKIGVKQKKAM